MRNALAILQELNRLLPVPEHIRHSLNISPTSRRLAICVWVLECAVQPARQGWREFFLDEETEFDRDPIDIAQEIARMVMLTAGAPLALVKSQSETIDASSITSKTFAADSARPDLKPRIIL